MSWLGRVRAVAVVVAVTTGVSCGVRENVCATVGGQELEIEVFHAHVAAVTGSSWEATDPRVAERLLDQFLDQEVVVAAARARRDVQIRGDASARSAAVRALLDEVCGPVPPVDAADIESEVSRRLGTPRAARARARQLLMDTEEEAVAARDRLVKGEEFTAVSREVSRAPNADAGGGIGLLSEGTLPEELDEVIFALGAGEISQPVRSPAGYHVFQVLEVVPEGPPSRMEVEASVRREMVEASARSFAERCIERLTQEVGVKVYSEHLWFRYHGRYAEDANVG